MGTWVKRYGNALVYEQVCVCVCVCVSTAYTCVYGRRRNNAKDLDSPLTHPAQTHVLDMIGHTASLVGQLADTRGEMERERECCVSYMHLPTIDEYEGVLSDLSFQHQILFYIGVMICPCFGILVSTLIIAPSLLGF